MFTHYLDKPIIIGTVSMQYKAYTAVSTNERLQVSSP